MEYQTKTGWWSIKKFKNGAWTLHCTITPNEYDLEHITRLVGEDYVEGQIVQENLVTA